MYNPFRITCASQINAAPRRSRFMQKPTMSLMQLPAAMLLFAITGNVQGATLATSVSVVCFAEGFSSSNPCSLTGTVPDPFTGELPYAQASASASADYGLLTTDVFYAA